MNETNHKLAKCRINTYCRFCSAEGKKKVKCIWKARYKATDHNKHFACSDHKHLIEDTDPDGKLALWNSPEQKALRKRQERESRSEHYTEADYQTWMRY